MISAGIIDSNQKIVANGLKMHLDAAHLRSYPGSGTTWTDLSGSGYNATLAGSPAFSSTNGGSIVFDGINDVVRLATNSVNSNADLTLNFWFQRVATPSTVAPIMFGTWDAMTGHLVVRFNDTLGSKIQLGKNYISDMTPFPNSVLPLNTIYYITVRCDRSTNTWTLLINGVFDPANSIVNSNTYTTTSPGISSNRSIQEFLGGYMYNFTYYNRVLSVTEVLQNFNATKSRFGY